MVGSKSKESERRQEELISKFHNLVLHIRLTSHQQRGVLASPEEKRYHDGVADGLSWAADMLVEFKDKKVRDTEQGRTGD